MGDTKKCITLNRIDTKVCLSFRTGQMSYFILYIIYWTLPHKYFDLIIFIYFYFVRGNSRWMRRVAENTEIWKIWVNSKLLFLVFTDSHKKSCVCTYSECFIIRFWCYHLRSSVNRNWRPKIWNCNVLKLFVRWWI